MNNTTQTYALARPILDRMVAEAAAYDADVEEWYATGDGRPSAEGGRGYTYPVCRHGMSRWTDYDNICWGCEEGISTTWESMAREAILIAKGKIWESRKRSEVVLSTDLIRRLTNSEKGQDARRALLDWILEPLD